MELTEYLPIVILGALGLAFAVLSLAVSSLLRPSRPTPAKLSAYECGIEPERLPRGERFSVKFHVIAMLFIIFDVETIFLFAWAVSARALGVFGLVVVGLFIVLLFVVEVYAWLTGGLDWGGRAPAAAVPEPEVDEERELVRAG